jgi:hypothetical protein
MARSVGQPARQSVMQYSLRAILIATLAVAVLCGVLAPFLRNSTAFREAFLRAAAMASLGAALPVAFNCWIRFRLEGQCGALLLVVSKHSRKRRVWMLGLNIIGAFCLLAFDIYINTRLNSMRAALPPARQSNPNFSILPFMAGSYLANVFLNFWWKGATNSTELCENGVIICGSRLIPWSEFRGYRKAFDGTLQMLERHTFHALQIPQEIWPEVIAICDSHIPALATSRTPPDGNS